MIRRYNEDRLTIFTTTYLDKQYLKDEAQPYQELKGRIGERLRSRLYEAGAVLAERERQDGGWELDIQLDRQGYEDLHRQENLQLLSSDGPPGAAVVN